MAQASLRIDLDALATNWRGLDAASGAGVETAATVKANGYGLGVGPVARKLAAAGVRKFFVALAEEGAALRAILGDGPQIFVYSGHMEGDAPLLVGNDLIPMLNSPAQFARHRNILPEHLFGVQLDSGMNRLGMEPAEWRTVSAEALALGPVLLQSHLACADEPAHPMNARQLARFHEMTDGLGIPRSLAATGGILLGADYHFDLTRPGIGLYGAEPYAAAKPVAYLDLPVIQIRDLEPGESVGYGNTWQATAPTKIATLAAGYADGIIRAMSNRVQLWHGQTPCPLRGRVSMDLLTIDVTHLPVVPDFLALIGDQQGVDVLADAAGTIGYEILTSLGDRYARHYSGEHG